MNATKPSGYKVSEDPILRSCGVIAAIYFGSLIIGGYWVFTIVLGISIFARTILIRIPFFQRIAKKFFGFPETTHTIDKPKSMFSKMVNTILSFIVMGIYFAISFIIVKLGVTGLMNDGFLSQNSIYIFFK